MYKSMFNIKYICALLITLSQLLFSTSVLAEDKIYTGTFSNKAVGGYDTVAYFTEGKPVKGNSKFSLSYKGADWYFASQENLDAFQQDPQRYAPQYGGYCAWAVAAKSSFAAGDPKFWRIVDDKLYLNYNQGVQKKWEKDIAGFISKGDANWPAMIN